MLDQAFAQIASAVRQAIGGPYHDATLLYDGEPEYDAGGSIVSPGNATTLPCLVQVDAVTEAMRVDADFMERDVRLLILGPETLTSEPRVRIEDGPFEGQAYELRSVARDPLGFGWECRARAISIAPPEPTTGDGQFDFSDPANSGLLTLLLEDA